MKAIKEYVGKSLDWIQPTRLKHAFELRAGNDLVGTLEWTEGLSSSAKAQSDDGSWLVQRHGFLRPRVTVRTAESTEDAAVFEPSWSGSGDVALKGGQRLRFVPANLWRNEWRLSTADGATPLKMRPDTGLMSSSAKLEIDAGAGSMPELPQLVFLTWAVLVLMEDDLAIFSI
jgi:hypothetical protein